MASMATELRISDLSKRQASALKRKAERMGVSAGDYVKQLIEDDLALDQKAQSTPPTNGLALPDVMPPRESRSMDAILQGMDGSMRLVEVDKSQHFDRFRATTLRLYPEEISLAFPVGDWLSRSESARR